MSAICKSFLILVFATLVQSQMDVGGDQGYSYRVTNPTLPFCLLGNQPVCAAQYVVPKPDGTPGIPSSLGPITYANECIAILLGQQKLYDGFCIQNVTAPIGSGGSSPASNTTQANGYPSAGSPILQNPCPCLTIYNPVCSSSSVTFMNLCVVEKCSNTNFISFGTCGSSNCVPPQNTQQCPCTFDFTPICGNDNVTYQNQCVALCGGATLKTQNACVQPCGCTNVYKPVCSTDFVTYNNVCLLNCARKQLLQKNVCPKVTTPNSPTACPQCVTQPPGLVCGQDTITYINQCYMQCAGTQLYQTGACPSNKPCNCGSLYLPVCGMDGNTYNSPCFLNCTNVPLAYNGKCQNNNSGGQNNPNSCSQGNTPVCGSDGKTYINICVIQQFPNIILRSASACPPITSQNCNYCNNKNANAVVCGVDGKTYSNICTALCLNVPISLYQACNPITGLSSGGNSGFGVTPVFKPPTVPTHGQRGHNFSPAFPKIPHQVSQSENECDSEESS